MTLGQEFNAFAITIGEDEARLAEAARLLCEINLAPPPSAPASPPIPNMPTRPRLSGRNHHDPGRHRL